MESTQRRMVAVAVFVCLFAVGMAGLLNYFKYRGTADRIVQERLVVSGRSIENTIQLSLSLGMEFADLAALPALLERERATDYLIEGIDVFDTDGRPLYSTDRLRASRHAPETWLDAARKAGSAGWSVRNGAESAAGISIENNFGLRIGYLALRYSDERIEAAAHAVGRQLLFNGICIFAVAALLAWLALMAVMRGLARDVAAVQTALQSPALRPSAAAGAGLFSAALRRFVLTTQRAESEIAELRGVMQRGTKG